MKEKQNCNANNNAESKSVKTQKQHCETENFNVTDTPSAENWDRTPDTAAEQVNAYGTYEIQPTAVSEYDFPAISQGLPSEEINPKPKSFHEGIIPELYGNPDVNLNKKTPPMS